jgi:hypothetical protein
LVSPKGHGYVLLLDLPVAFFQLVLDSMGAFLVDGQGKQIVAGVMGYNVPVPCRIFGMVNLIMESRFI